MVISGGVSFVRFSVRFSARFSAYILDCSWAMRLYYRGVGRGGFRELHVTPLSN